MNSYEALWSARLQERADHDLLRVRPLCAPAGDGQILVNGRHYHSFASNDYLGLSNHPQVKLAATKALEKCGVGGGASHMVCGHLEEHEHLENELAEFTGREKALVFSSGYMANLAVVSTLVGRGEAVLQDRLNHASLLDGGLLSGARFQRYFHNDPQNLGKHLAKIRASARPELDDSNEFKTILAVTDGVFSMDGDLADLPALAEVCGQYQALLMVDDAHGMGVLGVNGAGCIEHYGMKPEEVPVLIGTFGKAFGTAGAFVAGSSALVDYIEQFARPYIYTTSMPPAIAAATRQSLHLIRTSDLRAKLHSNITTFKTLAADYGLQLMPSDTAIQPILIGGNQATLEVAAALRQEGFMVGAIRPPTVPRNQARLRVTLSAQHCVESIESLVVALEKSIRTLC